MNLGPASTPGAPSGGKTIGISPMSVTQRFLSPSPAREKDATKFQPHSEESEMSPSFAPNFLSQKVEKRGPIAMGPPPKVIRAPISNSVSVSVSANELSRLSVRFIKLYQRRKKQFQLLSTRFGISTANRRVHG
jgi:hypothetical protein